MNSSRNMSATKLLLVITALVTAPGPVCAEGAEPARRSRDRRAIAEDAYQKVLADNAAQREKASQEYSEQARRQRSEQRMADLAAALEKIETKLLANDISAAEEIVKANFLSDDWMLRSDVNQVINFFSVLYKFRALVDNPKQSTEAVKAYASVVMAYDRLPKEIPFSQYLAGFIEGSLQKSEAFITKECGTDYKKLRLGMKLSRAQKCVADFELVGETKLNGSTVSTYYRANTYLYVKNGEIVSWNSY